MAEGTPFRKFLFIQQDKARATVEARRVLIGKNVVMIMVFEQIDDNSEKSQVCVGASLLYTCKHFSGISSIFSRQGKKKQGKYSPAKALR